MPPYEEDTSQALPEVRRQRLLELVRQRKSITTQDLVAALGASSATVRRDMAILEDLNLLKRSHGGAVNLETNTHLQEQASACLLYTSPSPRDCS